MTHPQNNQPEWERDVRGHFLQNRWDGVDEMVELIRSLLASQDKASREVGYKEGYLKGMANAPNVTRKIINLVCQEIAEGIQGLIWKPSVIDSGSTKTAQPFYHTISKQDALSIVEKVKNKE